MVKNKDVSLHRKQVVKVKAEAAKIARQVLTRHIENGYQGEVIVCCFSEADARYYQE